MHDPMLMKPFEERHKHKSCCCSSATENLLPSPHYFFKLGCNFSKQKKRQIIWKTSGRGRCQTFPKNEHVRKITFEPIDWGNVIVDEEEEGDENHDEDMTHHCVDLSLLCPPCLHSAFVPLTPRRCRRSVYSFKRTFAHSLRHNCISAGWVA